jgi:hypothetical protein
MARPSAEDSVAAAPELAIPLRAGPLRLVFDRGALRWIRLGEREVLRAIYFALRGENWVTIPPELEGLEVEAEPASFRIRFRARHERGPVKYSWDGRISGRSDGGIEFAVEGEAGSSFLRNRIGLCVLHPVESCAGRPCIVETVDGDRAESAFPARVAPHQPFRRVRAILHEVTAGVEAAVRMEGETFETEDQCNWGDTSFKTYGTSLHLPFPVRVEAGERLEQSVAVSLFGISEEPVEQAAASVPGAFPRKRNSIEPVVLTVTPVEGLRPPAIGLAGAGQVALGQPELERLRPLRLAYLRADLPLDAADWSAQLERAAENAARLGVPLELAVFLPRDAQDALAALQARTAALRPKVASWLVYGADHVTAEGHVPLARAALAAVSPGALFGGGSDVNFAELNRRRPTPGVLDKLVYAFQPQAHAFDDATIFENLGSLRRVADTLRSFSGGVPLGISPATLRPRVDASPRSLRGPGRAPFTDDPRQKTPFAAAWTLGLVASAAEAGLASLTLFELAGPRGVQDEGGGFPVLDALADVAALEGARVVPARPRRPERIQALALQSGGRVRLFLANVTGEAHPVRVEGLSGKAKRAVLAQPEGDESGLELELKPREVVRLDVALA